MPHSIQAEQVVLGTLMTDNQTWYLVCNKVQGADFYQLKHQLIFMAIKGLAEQHQPFDAIALSKKLDAKGELENGGSFSYLAMLEKQPFDKNNIVASANVVRYWSIARQLIDVGGVIKNIGHHDLCCLLEYAEFFIAGIDSREYQGQRGLIPIKSILAITMDKIESLHESDAGPMSTKTGFTDLDNIIFGLQPGSLTVVAGRPSMEIAAFVMNISENIAFQEKKPIAIFSMDTPLTLFGMRILSSVGRIGLKKIMTGNLEVGDWKRMSLAIELLMETTFFIDDTPSLTLAEIHFRATRLAHEQSQLGLLVIDYLELMHLPNQDKPETHFSEILGGLKALARQMNVPIIVLSRLNCNLERRPNKRPLISDLNEPDVIEQDADLIMFVYRDEVYNENSPDKGTAEIIIGKPAYSPRTVELKFLEPFKRFESFSV